MKSVFLGSAATVLLVFSAISYSKPFIQGQDPGRSATKPAVQEAPGQQPGAVSAPGANAESPKAEAKSPVSPAEAPTGTSVAPLANAGTEKMISSTAPGGKPEETAAILPLSVTYTATAYSLRGRTASGKPVTRGLIAADPALLPLGTRVRVEAGALSGEYLVADTGGAVRGRHIDIWTPSPREARQFGRRAVKLTVLAYGARRTLKARKTKAAAPRSSPDSQ